MKKLCLLFVLLVISTSVFGYFSVTHETEPLEARVCSLGYFMVTYDGFDISYPPVPAPCPFSSGQGFILVIDGVEYRPNYSGGSTEIGIDEYWESTEEGYDYYDSSRAIITTWRIDALGGDIVLKQILAPVTVDSLVMIRIKYMVESFSSIPHSVGFRTILDPTINGVDDIDFYTGPYGISEGLFYDTGIPSLWTTSDSSMPGFYVCGLNDTYCDQFGIGSAFCFTDPTAGVKTAGYDFESDCWIGQSIFDGCVSSRWNPLALESGDSVFYTTYYGIGSPYEIPPPGPSVTLLSGTNAHSTDCSIDSLQSFSALINNDLITIDSLVFCLTFNESSGIGLEGGIDTLCVSYSSLSEYEIRSFATTFYIPPGYSASESVFDTLYLWTDSHDSTITDHHYEFVYQIPYMNGLPPEVEFADRDLNFINCAHDFELNITDSDTTANTTDMRISINGVSYGSYTGLFTSDRSVTSIHLDSMLVTLEGDTLRIYEEDRMWPGRVIYCVDYLADMFGCEADIGCDTFYFDYKAPAIDRIYPPAEYTLTPGSRIIDIAITENMSGIDTTTLAFSINGYNYTLSDPELSLNREFSSLRFTPTCEFEDSLLIVCLYDVQDMVDVSSPNIIPDTCWHYYYNPEGPEEYAVTAHVVHSDDTPYEGLNVIWESTGMETEHGLLITDADGYCTLVASASDVYKIYPLVYFSRPSESRVWLSHENPVDTVEFVIFEDSAPTEYSCVIFARDCYFERYEFIEFGPVDSPERAVTSASGIGKYFLDSPGTYSFCIYHDHDYFTYHSTPDTFEVIVSDATPSDTIDILINPYNAITEQNIPDEYDIGIYPNPFNSVCNFDVPMGTLITVYDIYGRLIENIGINRAWSPSQNESGVYLVKFTFDNGEEIRRAIYIK